MGSCAMDAMLRQIKAIAMTSLFINKVNWFHGGGNTYKTAEELG